MKRRDDLKRTGAAGTAIMSELANCVDRDDNNMGFDT